MGRKTPHKYNQSTESTFDVRSEMSVISVIIDLENKMFSCETQIFHLDRMFSISRLMMSFVLKRLFQQCPNNRFASK